MRSSVRWWGRPPAIVSAAACIAAAGFAAGCGADGRLHAAAEDNRQNVAALVVNAEHAAEMCGRLAEVVAKEEVEAARTAVMDELALIGFEAPIGMSFREWSEGTGGPGEMAARLRGLPAAMAGSDDAGRAKLRARHPVLSAIAMMEVDGGGGAGDARAVVSAGPLGVGAVRHEIAGKYPEVREAEARVVRVSEASAQVRGLILEQGRLAVSHAELFVEAGGNGDVADVLGEVARDKGLRAEILGRIEDEESRETVRDALEILDALWLEDAARR